MQRRNVLSLKKKKSGEILVENVIFIVLNVLFISILAIFVAKQSSGAIVLEQTTAKNIALVIDSAKPLTVISIDLSKPQELAEKNGIPFEDIIKINGNVVSVKLSDKSGYDYAFFNDVQVSLYPDRDETNNFNGKYVFIINKKNE